MSSKSRLFNLENVFTDHRKLCYLFIDTSKFKTVGDVLIYIKSGFKIKEKIYFCDKNGILFPDFDNVETLIDFSDVIWVREILEQQHENSGNSYGANKPMNSNNNFEIEEQSKIILDRKKHKKLKHSNSNNILNTESTNSNFVNDGNITTEQNEIKMDCSINVQTSLLNDDVDNIIVQENSTVNDIKKHHSPVCSYDEISNDNFSFEISSKSTETSFLNPSSKRKRKRTRRRNKNNSMVNGEISSDCKQESNMEFDVIVNDNYNKNNKHIYFDIDENSEKICHQETSLDNSFSKLTDKTKNVFNKLENTNKSEIEVLSTNETEKKQLIVTDDYENSNASEDKSKVVDEISKLKKQNNSKCGPNKVFVRTPKSNINMKCSNGSNDKMLDVERNYLSDPLNTTENNGEQGIINFNVNDTVIFKVLTLSKDYCPTLSGDVVGSVIKVTDESLQLKLIAGKDIWTPIIGKFSLESDERQNGDNVDVIEINIKDMIAPKKISDSSQINKLL